MNRIFFYYLIAINAVAFSSMLIDKSKAIFKQYRIPERFFLILAVFGGGIGVMIGMFAFRHKIRKSLFTIWIPLVTVGVWGIGILLAYKFFRI